MRGDSVDSCVCFEARHPFCVDMVQILPNIQMVEAAPNM